MMIDAEAKDNDIPTMMSEAREKIKIKRVVEGFVKRLVDIVAGICGAIILIPLTIGIYIAKKILKEDDGPIFYEQLRIGKDGKNFRIYKYRTMIVGADEILEKYLEENEEAKAEYYKYKKLKMDPRVTKLGKFLRRTSLDEMPQFINILKGEMSLVGPRPYLPKEKEDMGIWYEKIIKCKPGITGFWQVNGRNDTTFEERLQMDEEYISTRSLLGDLKIIYKTIKKVIKQEGAV